MNVLLPDPFPYSRFRLGPSRRPFRHVPTWLLRALPESLCDRYRSTRGLLGALVFEADARWLGTIVDTARAERRRARRR